MSTVGIPQNCWTEMFPSVVSRAQTLEMLSTGVAGNYDGAIQLVRKISKYSLMFDDVSLRCSLS